METEKAEKEIWMIWDRIFDRYKRGRLTSHDKQIFLTSLCWLNGGRPFTKEHWKSLQEQLKQKRGEL
jgi:hypothetical protein